jgi:hypothetical protein
MKIIKAHDDEPVDFGEDQSTDSEQILPLDIYSAHVKLVHPAYQRAEWIHHVGARFGVKLADEAHYIREGRAIMIHFVDGTSRTVPVDYISELEDASDEDLASVAVTFAGTALSLVDRDVDISIAGLLKEVDGPEGSGPSGESFRGSMARKFN